VVVGLLAFIAAIAGVTVMALKRRTQSERNGAFENPVYESTHPVFDRSIQDGCAGDKVEIDV